MASLSSSPSIYHSSDSDACSESDGDDRIPMAVPIAELAAATAPDVAESDDEADDDDVFDAADDVVDAADDDDDDDDTAGSLGTDSTPPLTSKKRKESEVCEVDATGRSDKRGKYDDVNRRPRRPHPAPSSSGLTIPFRTIKRLMKIDPAVGIVQNDAAIVVAAAAEHFVKQFAVKSLEVARARGRNIVKYEDVATARANDRSLSFLDLLMP
jgi:histone H3/H4